MPWCIIQIPFQEWTFIPPAAGRQPSAASPPWELLQQKTTTLPWDISPSRGSPPSMTSAMGLRRPLPSRDYSEGPSQPKSSPCVARLCWDWITAQLFISPLSSPSMQTLTGLPKECPATNHHLSCFPETQPMTYIHMGPHPLPTIPKVLKTRGVFSSWAWCQHSFGSKPWPEEVGS